MKEQGQRKVTQPSQESNQRKWQFTSLMRLLTFKETEHVLHLFPLEPVENSLFFFLQVDEWG